MGEKGVATNMPVIENVCAVMQGELEKEDKAAIQEVGGHSAFLTILPGVIPMH